MNELTSVLIRITTTPVKVNSFLVKEDEISTSYQLCLVRVNGLELN